MRHRHYECNRHFSDSMTRKLLTVKHLPQIKKLHREFFKRFENVRVLFPGGRHGKFKTLTIPVGSNNLRIHMNETGSVTIEWLSVLYITLTPTGRFVIEILRFTDIGILKFADHTYRNCGKRMTIDETKVLIENIVSQLADDIQRNTMRDPRTLVPDSVAEDRYSNMIIPIQNIFEWWASVINYRTIKFDDIYISPSCA